MSQLVKYTIGITAAIVVILLLWYFRDIVAYILISAVLAIIGKPLVKALAGIHIKNRAVPRWLAALVTLLAIWAVTALFASLFFPLVFNKVSDLASLDVQGIIESFQDPILSFEAWLKGLFSIREDFSLMDELTKYLAAWFDINDINRTLSSIVSIIGNTFIAIFSITFITFFFLKEENLFQNMVLGIFPKKYDENVKHALDSATRLLTRYFTGLLAESLIIMLLLSGAFLVWGFNVETAFFIGAVMGILNVIPYVGPLMGATLSIVVGGITPLTGFSMLHMVFIIGGTILAVKMLDDFVLQPILYSNRVYAHPLEVFLVLLIGASIGQSLGDGIQGVLLGMLLAIPAYTVLRVFAKEFFFNYRIVQQLTDKI